MTNPIPNPSVDVELLVGQAVDEYHDRRRRGEALEVEEFIAGHPGIAAELRQILAAVQFLGKDPPGETEGPEISGTLGDFRILREIGRGGMGIVYEAEQISLGRRVALKVLPFAAALDSQRLRRFQHEALAAAQLHHTHIVPIIGVGCERGIHFFAMQFIDGRTLAQMIADLRFQQGGTGPEDHHPTRIYSARNVAPGQGEIDTPPLAILSTATSTRSPEFFRTAARLAMQAALALEHAHQFGLLHRDIKPANLLIDPHGNLWIADFGLVRLQNETRLTGTGDLVGTLRYMSPEQAAGQNEPVDQRSDIYSLGATLYELLTLQPMFGGEDRARLLRQIIQDDPALPRRLNKAVPVELETIVLKAIAKNPVDRYATAGELADDLRRFLEDKPVLARRPGLRQRAARFARRHRGVVMASAVFLVLAVVGLAVANLLLWNANRRTEAESQRANDQKTLALEAGIKTDRERRRAEENLGLALQALDQIYLKLIDKRLPRDPRSREENRALLTKILDFYQAFVSRNKDRLGAREENARAMLKVGDIYLLLGNLDAAAKTFTDAAGRWGELMKEHPGEGKYANGWAICRRNLGNNHFRRGDYDGALGPLLDAQKALEKLTALFPKNQDYEHNLAAVLHNLGSLYFNQDRLEKSEKTFQRALAILETLAGRAPERPVMAGELASTLTHLANILDRTGRPDQAGPLFQRAGNILEKLHALVPREPDFAHELARNHFLRGQHILNRGRHAEAGKYLDRARDLWKELTEEYAGVLEYSRFLGACLDKLAQVYENTGRPADAVRNREEALAIQEKLAAEYPGRADLQKTLAATLHNLGLMQRPQGRIQKGIDYLERAVAILEKITQPGSPLESDLAYMGSNLGHELFRAGKYPEARARLAKALALEEKLAADSPWKTERRRNLATTVGYLGMVLLITGQNDDAEKNLRRARDLHAELNKEFPDNTIYQADLALSLHNLGMLYYARKQYARARPLLEEGGYRYRKFFQTHSKNATARRSLAANCHLQGEVLLALGDHAAAAPRAEELAGLYPTRWQEPFQAAALLSRCAGLAEKDSPLSPEKRKSTADAYADKAMKILHTAVKNGLPDFAALKTDASFAPLRPRRDFQELVEKKVKTKG